MAGEHLIHWLRNFAPAKGVTPGRLDRWRGKAISEVT